MGFLNSWALWSGLAAAGVAVPIIIHLLYRKHRRQTDWAAMELLRRALVIRSGQVKLEDLLVLFLRCLAIALIALALLRPTLESSSTEWMGEQRVGMVIAIDASYSMNHGQYSKRYEHAVARAKKVLASARVGDPVSMILMSNRPKILMRSTGYDPERFGKILDEEVRPVPYQLNLDKNLEQIELLVDDLKTAVRECYILTDCQEADWANLSKKGQEILGRLTTEKDTNVFLVPTTIDSEDNLAITRLAYTSGALRLSFMGKFSAEVTNRGRRDTDGGVVELSVNGNRKARQAVGPIKAGETRSILFNHVFETEGNVKLKASLVGKDDGLKDDNERHAVVKVNSTIRVLCVDEGQQDQEDSRTGTFYAMHALRLKLRGPDNPMKVTHIDYSGLSQEKLPDFDVIILANVEEIDTDMAARLHDYVQRGGGLIISMGDRVNVESYNSRLATGDRALLPAKLLKPISVQSREQRWTIAEIRSKHPLAQIVTRVPKKLVDSATFLKIMTVRPLSAETILSITEQQTPLLLERKVGTGAVMLLTTTIDRKWTNFSIHPLFTMLLQQAVTNLTSDPDSYQITVGETAELAVSGRKVGDLTRMIDPLGKKTDLRVSQRGKQPVCAVDTIVPGIYELPGNEKLEAIALAANVDPFESNVRVIDTTALAGNLDAVGVRVVAEADDLEVAIQEGRLGREISSWLLILGVIVFLLQGFLARYFTRRMDKGQDDISASLQMSRVAAARRS